MQKPNKIAAFFFLGLFSLMMLHQVFSHLHHQHEDAHSHSDIAHTGEHHRHDDDSHDEESSYGFLGLFMEMHVHSTVSSDIVLLERNTIEQQTVVEKDVVKNSLETQNIFSIEYRQNKKTPVYHPPNKHFNPYLSSLDSRGPPSLG
ncbi:hypothetical protein [Leeuwenhoekiella nanhaiensis]|uniref:Uncharacterized protein n=1 Tax=Leeuwenhoekiella nanhaiensis TaxID=1655491 RepID=A0A2G1VME2_9FLAO|nr:hypothetical protein [Leeuwenhoekiella nanhaiensis]PHQ27928.1 hypothetical protein CJ305_17520 [Leeuwenhoekiella nanhaiensis]